MKEEQEIERAAIAILKSTGVSLIEAALIAKEALRSGNGRIGRARQCIMAGAVALRQREKTVCFEQAVAVALEARRGRRIRTVYDFRYFTRRFMKRCPGLAGRPIRGITPQDCAEYIEKAFDTPRQRQKARLILSGVFGTARKNGWCDENPVSQVEVPNVVERRVIILSASEIASIQETAWNYGGGRCAAAVGMMLYGGIRPHEVVRLTWADVSLRDRAIFIYPEHSKTGGARKVTIHRPLLRILEKCKKDAPVPICPANWRVHWRKLREMAGWNKAKQWTQDVLRHTFASYHLRYFRSFSELQYEMGHRDVALLRTRYVDQRGVEDAAAFWGGSHVRSTCFHISPFTRTRSVSFHDK